MKKISVLLTIVLLSFYGLSLQSQSLDEIVQKHIQAMGIDKIGKIKTYSMSGKADMAGISGPVKQMTKVPDKVRMEMDFNGQQLIQVINGEEAWMVMPMTGNTMPIPMEAGQKEVLQKQASLEGLLYKWKERGLKVSLEGKETLRNTSLFKIKVMEAGDQANATYLYIDPSDYLLKAQKDISYMSGQEVISMTYFDNYREFDGLQFPMRIESKMNGQTVMMITIGKVEVNQEIDDKVFGKP